MDIVLPRLTKILSVWELLLAKVGISCVHSYFLTIHKGELSLLDIRFSQDTPDVSYHVHPLEVDHRNHKDLFFCSSSFLACHAAFWTPRQN